MDIKQKKSKSDRPAAFAQPKPKPELEPAPSSPTSTSKKRLRITRKKAVTSVVVIIIVALIWIVSRPEEEVKPTTTGPDYTTVLPEGKSVVTLGGWQRVSPPEGDPVYAYTDKIEGVSVTVSQQPMPDKFHRNTNSQVEKLAKGYNATEKIDADGTTVYVGTSAKGPQSVILTKDDLLILIKSQKKVSNDAWKNYVDSLTTATLPNIPSY